MKHALADKSKMTRKLAGRRMLVRVNAKSYIVLQRYFNLITRERAGAG